MAYYIDLSTLSLAEFRRRLGAADLLPSQEILKEDLARRFKALASRKIATMHQLQQALKTKDKVKSVAAATSIPVEYLTVLRREVNSYHPQPRKMGAFPCLGKKTKGKLEKLGIRTTVDLYERIVTRKDRKKLQSELGISGEEVMVLTKLADVSRLRYVNQTFATLLVSSAYDTVEKIGKADHRTLHEDLAALNEERGLFKGKIGLKDMRFIVNDAGNASLDIEY